MSIDESDVEDRFYGITWSHFSAVLKKKHPLKYKNGFPVRSLKYSKYVESLAAFDRAYLTSSLNQREIRDLILKYGHKAFNKDFYLYAYFLQYKAPLLGSGGDSLANLIKSTCDDELGQRYIKFKLKTDPSSTSQLSQHEILKRISKMKRVKAYYALPVVFPDDENWDLNLKLSMNDLLLISPSECSVPILNNQEHHIVYNPLTPSYYYWCSKPEKHSVKTTDELFKNEEFLGRFDSFEEFIVEILDNVFDVANIKEDDKIKYFFESGLFKEISSFTNLVFVPKEDVKD